jgi:hypothetical protein
MEDEERIGTTMERLTDYLRASGVDRLELRISEIESIVGTPLPESAKNWRAFWNNSDHNNFSRYWLSAGYRVTTRTASPGVVGFVRERGHTYLSPPGRSSTFLDPSSSLPRRERRPEPPSFDQYRDLQRTAGGLPQRRPPELKQGQPPELPQRLPPEQAPEPAPKPAPEERADRHEDTREDRHEDRREDAREDRREDAREDRREDPRRDPPPPDYLTREQPPPPPTRPPGNSPERPPENLAERRAESRQEFAGEAFYTHLARMHQSDQAESGHAERSERALPDPAARSERPDHAPHQARDDRRQHLADEGFDPIAIDSAEMRQAETAMIEELGRRLGMQLSPRSFVLPEGGRVVVDAANGDAQFLCEAWAYQGPPRAAQRNEVVAEAFKLHFLAQVLGGDRRLALLFGDAQAAAPFRGTKWFAQALRLMGIEIHVVDLSEELRRRVITTQER